MAAHFRMLVSCLSVILLAALLTACSSGSSSTSSYEPPQKSPAEKLYDAAVEEWTQYADKPDHKSLACGFKSDGGLWCAWAWSDPALAAAKARALRDCAKETGIECFTFAEDNCMSEWAIEVEHKYGSSREACTATLSDSELLYGAGTSYYAEYQEKPEPKARVCGLLEGDTHATCYNAWAAETVELAVSFAMKLCEERTGRLCQIFARNGTLSDWAETLAARYALAKIARDEITTVLAAAKAIQQLDAQETETPQAQYETPRTDNIDPDDDSSPTSTDVLSGLAAGLSVLNSMPRYNTGVQGTIPTYNGNGQDMRSLSNSQATRREAPVMQYYRARLR